VNARCHAIFEAGDLITEIDIVTVTDLRLQIVLCPLYIMSIDA